VIVDVAIVSCPVVKTQPFTVEPAPIVTATSLNIVPAKLLFVPRVDAPVITQKISSGEAPLVNTTLVPATVFNAPVILKM